MDFPMYFQILRGRVPGFSQAKKLFFFCQMALSPKQPWGVPNVSCLSSPLIVIPYPKIHHALGGDKYGPSLPDNSKIIFPLKQQVS